MPRVIINADDLGLSERVNDAIFALMQRRRVTSATLMANGPALEDAARRCRDCPQCSFGVHLNLTDLKPLTADAALAPLVNESGMFCHRARAVSYTPQLRAAAEREWIAQIECIRGLGVPVTHFDSHHHVHTHPPLFSVLKRVQRATGITRVRTTMNLYHPSDPLVGGVKHRIKKRLWHAALRWSPPRTRTTDAFTPFWVYHDLLPGGGAGGPSTARTVELMVHPGSDDATFQREEQLLDTPWEQAACREIEFISYHNL